MLIDLWKHFPNKFSDHVVQDRVLDEIKNCLRRSESPSSVQVFAIVSSLIDIFEFLITEKSDKQSKTTAYKIKNLISHVLNDTDMSKASLKEFMLQQVFFLIKKGHLILNDFIKIFLRLFQSHGNLIGNTDIIILDYMVEHIDELSDKNILCLLDFNCHLFMSDTNTIYISKRNILKLIPAFQFNEASVTQFQKFIRLMFNWVYRIRINRNKVGNQELNLIREKHIINLCLSLVTRPDTSQKISLVVKNLAALINFQLKRFSASKRAKNRLLFMPGFKELILAVPSGEDSLHYREEGRISPDEVVGRFERIFEYHLGDRLNKDLEIELDKLIVSADLSKKRMEPLIDYEKQDLGELSSIMSKNNKTMSEKEKHKAKMDYLNRIEEKMKIINSGANVDQKIKDTLITVASRRKENEHQRLLDEANSSVKRKEKEDRQFKEIEEIKIFTGTRADNTPDLTLEQLTRPLGRLLNLVDSEAPEIFKIEKFEMFYSTEDEESEAVRIWFNKNNLLIRGLYYHFAGSLTKAEDVKQQVISWAELLRFSQILEIDQSVNSTVVGWHHADQRDPYVAK